MKKIALVFLLLSFASSLFAQGTSTGGQTGGGAPSGPAGGALSGSYPNPTAGQSIAPNTGVFTISNNCGTQTNCLQWADNDSTDNCGTATTTFMAAINAYAGAGRPQVFMGGSGVGKAYKLATAGCNLAFLIPTELHHWASLDCAQPATTVNCIQAGPTGLSGLSAAQSPPYDISGGGTMLGGANLTTAGIECEPFISNCMIDRIHWTNFGAGNATSGSCTNSAVSIDTNVAEATISYNEWVATDATAGRCAFLNPGGASTGQNTVYFIGNILGGKGSGGVCASQGIVDGGSYGASIGNNIFAFGVPLRLLGIGHRVDDNQLDPSTCVANSVHAMIHIGGTSSSAQVGPAIITNNTAEFYTGGASFFMAIAGDSTGTLSDAVITGNNAARWGSLTTGTLMPSTLNCTNTAASTTNCYIANNVGLSIPTNSCGTTFSGWQVQQNLESCSASAQSANIGPVTVRTPVAVEGVLATCTVVLTRADSGGTSTLPQCTISYTDFYSNTAVTTTITPAWASGTQGCTGTTSNAVSNACSGSVRIAPKAGTTVTYSTTGYVSPGTTKMQYNVSLELNLELQP